ncbi:16102_t:CDS:2, partial [Gigaspora margarita]
KSHGGTVPTLVSNDESAKEALIAAQERQETYANKRRRFVEFSIGKMVMLKICKETYP